MKERKRKGKEKGTKKQKEQGERKDEKKKKSPTALLLFMLTSL